MLLNFDRQKEGVGILWPTKETEPPCLTNSRGGTRNAVTTDFKLSLQGVASLLFLE